MAQLSLLLLRRFSSASGRRLFSSPLSSLSSAQTTPNPNPNPNPPDPTSPTSSLSARMSYVFDQIDAIEKERAQKDETLTRIRAWRESKKATIVQNDAVPKPPAQPEPKKIVVKEEERGGLMSKEVELVHPWPEWIEFMERLVQQNYFDHKRKDEEKMLEDSGFHMEEVEEEGLDFTRDWKTVQTACLNFGRDRFDILRSLSRQDIQTLVGYGCPSADKKVVFSGKLLRKYVHLDEGDVCSSCKLRNSCERAYLLTNKEDEARTYDAIRILLTFGFDPVNGSVVNESLLKIKPVKNVVRKLLHEVVKFSSVPIDPNLSPPVIIKPPPKVKQPPPPPKKRVGRDDIEMKMGDWICTKCDFMNFAKNTICLQCDAKRPKRQLLPGEWECPECNFLNYRRNTVCFHCEHKRPPDEFMENQFQDRRLPSRSKPEKILNRDGVCNAWNFDFDDNESDGADVAAFEYADSQKMDEDFALHNQVKGDNFRGPEAGPRAPRVQERDYNDHGRNNSGTGFDDFDDEEDDIDSYELDTHNNTQANKSTSVDFSEVEGHSESEDMGDFDRDKFVRRKNFSSHKKPSKGGRRNSLFSSSEVDELDLESDEDLSAHSKQKSSRSIDSRHRSRSTKAFTEGSDDDFGIDSDTDDFADSGRKGDKRVSHRRDFKRTRIQNSDDESFSGLDSDEEGFASSRDRFKHGKSGREGSRLRSNGKSKLESDFGRSRGSRGNDRGFQREDNDFGRSGGPRGNGRGLSKDDNDFGRSRGPRDNSRGFQRNDNYFGKSRRPRGNSRGFQSDDDDFGKSRGPRGNVRGFQRNDDDFGGSRGFRGNGKGFQRDDHGGRRLNGKSGFGNHQKADMSSEFEDERYRRPRENVR